MLSKLHKKYYHILLYFARNYPASPEDIIGEWYSYVLGRGKDYEASLFFPDGNPNFGRIKRSILQSYLAKTQTVRKYGAKTFTGSEDDFANVDNFAGVSYNLAYVPEKKLNVKEQTTLNSILYGGNIIDEQDVIDLAHKLFPDKLYAYNRKMLRCKKCGKLKPYSCFYANRKKKNGKSSYCKKCTNSYGLAR